MCYKHLSNTCPYDGDSHRKMPIALTITITTVESSILELQHKPAASAEVKRNLLKVMTALVSPREVVVS